MQFTGSNIMKIMNSFRNYGVAQTKTLALRVLNSSVQERAEIRQVLLSNFFLSVASLLISKTLYGERRFFSNFVLCLALIFGVLFAKELPVQAQGIYPAPWPATWTAYTYLGTPIMDPTEAAGSRDPSTGGTAPTQEADIVPTNGVASTWYAYDTTNEVLFVRLHLNNKPINNIGTNFGNGDPYTPTTWSLLIDSDADGFKEFAVQLNGASGVGGVNSNIDDIAVFYDNGQNQQLLTPSQRFITDSASVRDRDARAAYHDFGPSRAIEPSATGGGWFLDWQIPISAFTDASGNQLITPSTPVSFAFGTANSNTNPLQKDFAFNGTFSAVPDQPIPFGDPATVGGTPTQAPQIISLTSSSCGPATLTASVVDTLIVNNGVATTSVNNVKFYYQPDSDANGTPDTNTTPTLIGTATTPIAGTLNDFRVTWDNHLIPSASYVVFAVATDQQSNSTTSINQSPPVYVTNTASCGLTPNVSGTVYNDANHNATKDTGENGVSVSGLHAKIFTSGATTATSVVPIDQASGTFFFAVPNGTYSIIIDDNSTATDLTASRPAGYIGTEAPNQIRTGVAVTTGNTVSNQNFGLYNGSRLTGMVYHDNGAGGGTAGDGIRNGTEPGLSGVTVNLTNLSGTAVVPAQTTDGSGNYTFYIPAATGSVNLRVVETNLANYVSTGGLAGTTGGAYDISTDIISFTNSVGADYSGVNFLDRAVPNLQISKTVSPTGVVTAGQVLTYTITATNNGAANTSGTTLQDFIPAGTAYISNSTQLNSISVADVSGAMPFVSARAINSPTRPAGQINVGESAVVTFQAQVDSTPPASIDNTATIDVDGSGPNGAQNASVSNPVARLIISKASNPTTQVQGGDTITYTITLQNIGSGTSSGTTLLDPIPSGTSYVTGSTTVNGSSVSDIGGAMPFASAAPEKNINSTGLSGGQIAPGATVTVTFQVMADTPAPQVISNTATVDVDGPGPSPGVSATAQNPSVRADLTVDINDGRTSVVPGGSITYTITVGNNGPDAVSAVRLEITLPGAIQNPIFTPSQGSYDSATELWSGITLPPGGTVTLTVSGTVAAGTNTPITVSTQVAAPTGVSDTNLSNNSDSDTNTTGVVVSGMVYNDANHNGIKDATETGVTINGLYAKIIPQGSTTASEAVAVISGTGSYSFAGIASGTYSIILDDNNLASDVTASVPAGYIATEGSNGERSGIVVNTSDVTNIYFGLFNGSRLSGFVFRDAGAGGGIANDGIRNGAGLGIAGSTVEVRNAAGTTVYASTTSGGDGSYVLHVPASAGNTSLLVVQTNLGGYVSTGATVGNTGGTYTRSTDSISYNDVSGTTYTGVNFGDVPAPVLTNSGNQPITAGGIAEFSHVFTSGTFGSVDFTVSHAATPNIPGWSALIYRDINGNGIADASEPQVTGAITTQPGVAVPLVVRVYAPANAAPGNNDIVTLTAEFTYTGATPSLVQTLTQTDTATVQSSSGLQLSKAVSHTQAKKGDIITYTITYRNTGATPVSNIVIYDTTPAFTTFVGQSNGALPNNITSISANINVGSVAWTLNGSLQPGQSGTVSFDVELQ